MNTASPTVCTEVKNTLLAPFAALAAIMPHAIAVQSGSDKISYAGLAAATAAYAAALHEHGIGNGAVVALSADRSPETVALILAIIANGAAYLPLDPHQTDARLAAMIEDAQPRLLVADGALCARLRTTCPCIDRAELKSTRTDLVIRESGDLAYVVFTSGSTGRPKGVAMRTRAVAALIDWHQHHPRLSQAARTLQFAPLGFDVSFQEIFSTLATGGTLILPTDGQRRDPWALLDLLKRERVERLFLPYVALQAIAEAAIGERGGGFIPTSLTDVISAGEQLHISPALRAFFSALGDCVLHNHYGPTETHVVTAHELRGDTAAWPDLPPIGVALPHARVRIADDGQLLIGGDCLARGYIGQPQLTADRFIELDDERWYLSGDRVRRNASGELEYLGRLDDQIKVAGHRIEPAEIEAALCRHPQVVQAAVVAEAGVAGSRLIAHIVPRDLAAQEWKVGWSLGKYCVDVLPEYLRPQGFVLHSVLPTTASGKIDRSALSRARDNVVMNWNDSAPLTSKLTGLWQQLLGVADLPSSVNLFDAGARSLDVVHALAELRRHGHAVSVAQIYEHPTIAAQAQLLAAPRPNRALAISDRQRAAFAQFASSSRSR